MGVADRSEAAGRIVITEIMYNPASDESGGKSEWVEIANLGDEPVDLANWRLDDEDTLPMDKWGPFSCVLAPGAVAVLIHNGVDEAQFRAAWDVAESEGTVATEYLVVPVKWGSLANAPSETNEILRLLDGDGAVVCEVNFRNGDGWPKLTIAGGPSIHLADLNAATLSNELSHGAHWRASKAGEHGAVGVRTTAVFDGKDVGSPGRLPAASVPTPPVPASSSDASSAGTAGPTSQPVTSATGQTASQIQLDPTQASRNKRSE